MQEKFYSLFRQISAERDFFFLHYLFQLCLYKKVYGVKFASLADTIGERGVPIQYM